MNADSLNDGDLNRLVAHVQAWQAALELLAVARAGQAVVELSHPYRPKS